MNYHDEQLAASEFKTVPMPFATYCAISTCQTLITPGTPAKKYDGATYAHVVCPNSGIRTYAPHKHPNTGMRFNTPV